MTLVIPARFHGPPTSGNGGYTAGLLAAELGGGPAEITLRKPPPLDTPLTVSRQQGSLLLYAAGELIAEAVTAAAIDDVVPAVGVAEATAASETYPGFVAHPFPTCFTCGPARDDGLRIFPGRLPDGRTAAPWLVPAVVDAPTVWAALDCPGGWTVQIEDSPHVLGRIAADLTHLPTPGTTCVVVGRVNTVAGRKATVSTTLYDPAGTPLATSHATWIALKS